MEKTGESTRQLKVAKEIQKVMAEIIRSKGMAAFGGALVSVSGVKVSPDLSVAKIYVSVFPSDKAEAVMERLRRTERRFAASSAARWASSCALFRRSSSTSTALSTT